MWAHSFLLEEGMFQEFEFGLGRSILLRLFDRQRLVADNADPSEIIGEALSVEWMFFVHRAIRSVVVYGVEAKGLCFGVYYHVAVDAQEAVLVKPLFARSA